MKYSKSSSAESKNITRTLKAFGYSSPGKLEDYDVGNVMTEIRKGYPVIMSGVSNIVKKKIIWHNIKTQKFGHAWLLHGLLSRTRKVYYYYHGQLSGTSNQIAYYLLCNWGWGGNHDGYFLTNLFDVNITPINENTQSSRSEFEESDPNNVDNTNEEEILNGTEGYYQYDLKAVTGIRP